MRRRIFIMSLYVYEVLEKAAEAKTKEEKVEILQKNNSLALRSILRGGMDDTIQFILPEGMPPYDVELAERSGFTRGAIQSQCKRFKFFIKGGEGERLNTIRRETMFINMLESVHPKEAELLVMMKDKKLIKKTGTAHYKGVTKKLVQDAFPNLIKD